MRIWTTRIVRLHLLTSPRNRDGVIQLPTYDSDRLLSLEIGIHVSMHSCYSDLTETVVAVQELALFLMNAVPSHFLWNWVITCKVTGIWFKFYAVSFGFCRSLGLENCIGYSYQKTNLWEKFTHRYLPHHCKSRIELRRKDPENKESFNQ